MLISRDFFARHSVQVAPDLLGCILEHETAAGLVAVRLTEVEAYAGETDPASHAYHGKTRRNAVMFGPPGHAYVYFTYGMHFCVNLVCLRNGGASAVLLRAGAVTDGEELARARRTRGAATVATRDLARGPARLCQALDIDRSLDGADVCAAGSPLRIRWPDADTTVRSGAVLAPADDPRRPPRGDMAREEDPSRPPRTGTARGDDPPRPPRRDTAGEDDPPSSPGGGITRGNDPAGPRGTILPDPPGRVDPSHRPPPGPPRGKIACGPRVGVSAAAEVPWRFWIEGEPSVSAYRPHVPRRRKLVTS